MHLLAEGRVRLPSPRERERKRERWMAAGPDPIFRRDIIIPGESPASRGNTRYYVLLSDPTIDRHGGDVSIATRRAGMGADKWRAPPSPRRIPFERETSLGPPRETSNDRSSYTLVRFNFARTLRNNRTIFPCEVKKIREKRGRERWKNFREDVDNKFLAECGGEKVEGRGKKREKKMGGRGRTGRWGEFLRISE